MKDTRLGRPVVVKEKGARRKKILEGLVQLRESPVGALAESQLTQALTRVGDALSKRENIESAQAVLARVGQFVAERSFEADPDAAQLFEFAQWAEAEHGRAVVLTATLQLANALVATLTAGKPTDPATIASMQDEVRRWGRILVVGYPVEASGFDPERVPQAFRAVFEARRAHTVGQKSSGSAITTFIPGADDAALTYAMVTLPRFLQTYLMRGLVDALPDIADKFTHNDR